MKMVSRTGCVTGLLPSAHFCLALFCFDTMNLKSASLTGDNSAVFLLRLTLTD